MLDKIDLKCDYFFTFLILKDYQALKYTLIVSQTLFKYLEFQHFLY